MTLTKRVRTSEWIVDNDFSAKLSLYGEVGEPLRRGARDGIRSLIQRTPPEHEVEEVAVLSFNVLWKKDLGQVGDVGAMAFRIAAFAGKDRGRRILREQRKERPTAPDELVPITNAEVGVDETAHSQVMELVARCKEHLTDQQRLVISVTIEGEHGEEPMKLSEWADLPGSEKSYEAWRRQRKRGLASLYKCVQTGMETSGASGSTHG